MRLSFLLILITLLAACGTPTPEAVGDLPTVAELPTLTDTDVFTPTVTVTSSATATDTLTPTLTLTSTISVTPSATITDTPTRTPTVTPSPTPRESPLLALAQAAARATILPQALQPATPLPAVGDVSVPGAPQLPSNCPQLPAGGFGALFLGTPSLVTQLGCPSGTATNVSSAVQSFERGTMIWVNGPIYALYSDGRYEQHSDTFVAGVDPESGSENPPAGLIEPVRGFGKVWRTTPSVRNNLGWGTTAESGGTATFQRFDFGWMLNLSQRGDILVLAEDPAGSGGTWTAYPGNF